MDILLTSEEALQADSNFFKAYFGEHFSYPSNYERDEAKFKAQLKRVVEEIKRNAYLALDKRTGDVELGSVIISPQFWKAILKEIE